MSCPREVAVPFVGSATSSAIDIKEGRIVGLILPATHVGITMKFQATNDPDGGTYTDVTFLSGMAATALTITGLTTLTAFKLTLDPSLLAGFRYLKLVSASSETMTAYLILRDADGGR